MGAIIKSAGTSDEDIKLINKYTRREFKAEEVYVFSVVLCDNEIDRDNERFTVEALFDMEKMFTGKTGIFNHEPKAQNQSARIFQCRVENIPSKKTSFGDDYFRLTAKAYIPVCDNTKDLILLIDSGILKEVSVGCSVSEKICSVCGKDFDTCRHIKGKSYNGSTCCCLLSKPADAYEWSFVAVPSQRDAGVIKGIKNYKEKYMDKKNGETFVNALCKKSVDAVNILRESDEIVLKESDCRHLSQVLGELLEDAKWGREYKSSMRSKFVRLSAVVQPEISAETAESLCEKLSIAELKEFIGAYEKQADKIFPCKPQLFCNKDKKQNTKNSAFEI